MTGWAAALVASAGCANTTSEPKDSTSADTGPVDKGEAFDSDSATDSGVDDSGDSEGQVVVDLADAGDVKLISDEESSLAWAVSVSAAGDVDGDGYRDLVLGRPYSELGGTTSGGAAYYYRGPLHEDVFLSAADARMIGTASEGAGSAVAGLGDVNADGFDDLIIGSPRGHPDSEHPDLASGQAQVLFGPVTGDVDLTAPDAVLVGEFVYAYSEYGTWGSSVGASVAGAGDVNGDGFADVLVGGPGYSHNLGIAYFMSGPMTGEVDLATQATMRLTATGPGNLGSGVASAGDTNGDGLSDVVIGQYGDSEACTLVFVGPVSGDLTPADADATVSDSLEAVAGESPRSAGDVDGDGYADLAVDGDSFDGVGENAGAVFLFLGPFAGTMDTAAAQARLQGSEAWSRVDAVDGAGDVNGDGFADLVIGAPGYGGVSGLMGPGKAFVVLGPVSGVSTLSNADIVINDDGDEAGESSDHLGETVAGAGDIDGDGLADILIGGGGDDEGGENAGAAWLVFGSQMR